MSLVGIIESSFGRLAARPGITPSAFPVSLLVASLSIL
jgi:hypothetical protein